MNPDTIATALEALQIGRRYVEGSLAFLNHQLTFGGSQAMVDDIAMLEQRLAFFDQVIADLTTQAELPMLNADGLLPCPFCGNTNIDATNYTDPSEYWMIYCPSCRILMDTVGRTKDEAFALWNQRTPAMPQGGAQWTPVPDGEYIISQDDKGHGWKIKVDGQQVANIGLPFYIFRDVPYGEVDLPDGWVLMQPTPASPATLPPLDELSPVQLKRLSNFYDQLIDDDSPLMREVLHEDAPAPEGVTQWERDFPPEWDRHPWANWACLVASYSNFDGITLMWNYFEDKPEWGELSYNWVSGTHGFANPVKRRSLRAFFDTKDTLRQRPPASQG